MTLEQRIRNAETDLFHGVGAEVDEPFLDLVRTGAYVRLVSHGSGRPLVLLHGVSLSAAVCAPLFTALSGWRMLALDLPGLRIPLSLLTVRGLSLGAIDHFHRPRPESVLTTPELRAIEVPTMFIWGTEAPYLTVDQARPSIDQIPDATLHRVPGGHGPWLLDTEPSAELIRSHLTNRRGAAAVVQRADRDSLAGVNTPADFLVDASARERRGSVRRE